MNYLFVVRQYKMNHFEIFAFEKYSDPATNFCRSDEGVSRCWNVKI